MFLINEIMMLFVLNCVLQVKFVKVMFVYDVILYIESNIICEGLGLKVQL